MTNRAKARFSAAVGVRMVPVRGLSCVSLLVSVAAACGGGGSNTSSSAQSSDGGSSGSSGSSSSSGSGSSSGAGSSSGGGSSSGASSSGGSSSSGGMGTSSPVLDLDAGPILGADGGPISGVVFKIDVSKGPARQYQPPGKPAPISPYVYGINSFGAWESTTKWGVLRWGGNAFTSWNWTNNFSNSGSDFCFWQGNEGGGNALAGSISGSTFPSVPTDISSGIASLVTVPILDHVSSSAVTNNVWSGSNPPCPGSPSCSSGSANGYAANVANLDFASTDASSTAFVANKAAKGSAFCTCEAGCGSACAVNTTGAVYEDEFVNYMKVTYGSGAAPVFFSLDNEPNYWAGTHPELWPYTGKPGCGTSGTETFDQITSRNITFATAIKAAWPAAKVFGPVVAQDGIIYGGNYSDPNLPTTFTDYYLKKLAAASMSAGKPLIDAYDIHYYTSNGSNDQCPQVPRMFWDPTFKDFTASASDSIDYGWSGQNNYFDTDLYPRQMIPRMLAKIGTAYAGNSTAAPGLSFSEYDVGCEGVIQGGVAEADVLGVFGREGVYSATAWPLKSITNDSKQLVSYLVAAYDLYRNYDGNGAVVGDMTVNALTTDIEKTSVYAFAHSGDASAVDVVAINKTSGALPVTIQIASAPALSTAKAYDLVDGKVAVVAVATGPTVSCSAGTCSLTYTLPAMSATTLVLR